MNKHYLIAIICLPFFVSQCKKPDTTPASPAAIVSATPYINATIDSTSISIAPGDQYQAIVDNGSPLSINNDSTIETYNYSITSLLSGNSYIAAIYAGDYEFAPPASKPSDTAFYGYFNRGYKKFSFGILAPYTYHVAFNWIDSKGNTWQTNPPSAIGDQTGSSFTVDTLIQTSPKNGGSVAIKLQAHFNCKIYNSGNYKKVTNGTCVVYFENK